MPPVPRAIEQWGTIISIDVRDSVDEGVRDSVDEGVRDSVDEGALDACESWFARVDDLFSTWRAETEIMRIARGELAVERASREVQSVLELCEQMRLESEGAFDIAFAANPHVVARPGFAPLDPSGLVKGWAVARAGDILVECGAETFFINAGGDVLTRGAPAGTAGWRLGIQHPWERDRVAAVLVLTDAAAATSGRYERGDHVIDPRTGAPVTGLTSVTVVGPDLAIADAYATAAVVLGPEVGMRWLTTRIGYEAMGITDDQMVLVTPGFERYRVS